jgi:hypothetical protein
MAKIPTWVWFESGDFAYDTASKSITFNDTGTFSYFEKDVIEDDPNFVMNGTINVVNQPSSITTTTNEWCLTYRHRYCWNINGSSMPRIQLMINVIHIPYM